MNIKNKLLFLSFFLVLTFNSNAMAKEAIVNESIANETKKVEQYYQVNNQNTILILKEKSSYFKRLPLNSLFVNNLKWSNDLELKIKKDLSIYQVISKEIIETVSSKALQTISKAIDKERPKLVVIALGENDGLFSKTIEEIRQYLAAIIKTAHNANAKVILVGNQLPLHYGTEYTHNFVEMYTVLAKHYDIAYVPVDKISSSYRLFLYSYNSHSIEKKSSSNLGDKIWLEVDKIMAKDKKNVTSQLLLSRPIT